MTKRLTAARFAGVPELEAAFTDFSDASDISDGDGVRPPHQGDFVALLQQSLIAMGYPLWHGVNGIYTAETKNAVIALQIDAGHPLHAGHDWEHIGGIGGPNTLAHFDMFDPGGTVGSHDIAPTGIATRTAAFAESADHPFAGFDATLTPSALVVGVNTRRRVRIVADPVGSDLSFVSSDEAVAVVGQTLEGIVVGGKTAGAATIEARSGDVVLANLRVFVKAMRREVANFFFVRNSGRFSTTRTAEQATLLTLRLNRVWRRQANVVFSLGRVQEIALPEGLVNLEAFSVPGQFNIFCVAEANTASADPSIAFLDDADCPDKMDVAHASARFLGFRGANPKDGLMAECAAGAERRRVPKILADIVNP